MTSNILSSFFSTSKFTIADMQLTSVYLATNFKVKKVTARYVSKPHRHKREDGTSIVDARRVYATSLIIEGFCPDSDTLQAITDLANSRGSMYEVISKGMIFDNMKVDEASIQQIPKALTSSPITIRMTEQLVRNVAPVVFAQSADSSLIDRGFTALQSASTTVAQMASTTESFISGLL